MSTHFSSNNQSDERPTLPPIRDLIRDISQDDYSYPTLARPRFRSDNGMYIPQPSVEAQYPAQVEFRGMPGIPVSHYPQSQHQHPQEWDRRPLIGTSSPPLMHSHTEPTSRYMASHSEGAPYDPRAYSSHQNIQSSTAPHRSTVHEILPGFHNDTTRDYRTTIGNRRTSAHSSSPTPTNASDPPDEGDNAPTLLRYECTFCGKGFSRPSSLKIHLNSHTGEKPFVCPVETCRRSFSVLSNMRRHARVHSQPTQSQSDPSSS